MSVEVRIHDKLRGTEQTWEHPGPVMPSIVNGQLLLSSEAALANRWRLLSKSAGTELVEQ